MSTYTQPECEQAARVLDREEALVLFDGFIKGMKDTLDKFEMQNSVSDALKESTRERIRLFEAAISVLRGQGPVECIMQEQDNGWHEDRLWSCSACGDERAMDGLPDEYGYNYCVNCGAKITGQSALPALPEVEP